MSELFVALGVMVLALLVLLLWFVPHLLHQQAARVAGETAQLREMLLDLLNEQEAVAMRQTQLGTSLTTLQSRIETLAHGGGGRASAEAIAGVQQLEARLAEVQGQIQSWADARQRSAQVRDLQDNEAWANLLGLLSAIQDRIGAITTDRASTMAALQAGQLLDELEQEMQHLRSISEDITALQHRLRRSLGEREQSHANNGARARTASNITAG